MKKSLALLVSATLASSAIVTTTYAADKNQPEKPKYGQS